MAGGRRVTSAAVGLIVAALGVAAAAAGDIGGDAMRGIEYTDVFSRGSGGYPVYRIPAVVALDTGAVLAFAEARSPESEEQHDDHAENDIVLRRSMDGGRTWGPLQVVAEMGGDSLNDPCAVVLPDSGRVLLMYQRFPKGYHARRMSHTEVAELGYGGPRNTQTFLAHSDDGGATWSAPREITRSVRREDAISIGSPGNGVVLSRGRHVGRVLLPLYEVIPIDDDEERYWRNCVAYSDDGGETWRLGGRVPLDGLTGCANECQIAELADGSVRMHARLQFGALRVVQAVSRDGGESWTPFEPDPALVTTPCMTSLIAYRPPETGETWLLASLPNSTGDRANGTVFLSRDGGQTWPLRRVLYEGGFAYSSLTVLPDGRVGCLFERGPYDHVTFAAFPVDWLLDEAAAAAPVTDDYWGRPIQDTRAWERVGRDLLWNFDNMYQPCVVEFPGETYRYRMWFMGWSHGHSNPRWPGSDAIFHARSKDLLEWEVYAGDAGWDSAMDPERWFPVIHAGDRPYDEWHNGDPSVVFRNGRYYMAFSATSKPFTEDIKGHPNRMLLCIMGATSDDGIHWEKTGHPILIESPEVQRPETDEGWTGDFHRPCLLWDGGRWRLWFDYWHPTRGVCMGYAENTGDFDAEGGFRVMHDLSTPLIANWPNPEIVRVGDRYHSFADPTGYAPMRDDPNAVWTSRVLCEAVSPDGIRWEVIGFIPPDPDAAGCHVPQALVTEQEGQRRLYVFYATQRGGILNNAFDYRYDRIRAMRRELPAADTAPATP